MNSGRTFNASEMLASACAKHQVHLATLFAETALWANRETHFRQIRQSGSPAVYPGIRRARPGQGEKRGVVNGIGLDDNTYANGLIKRMCGLDRSNVVGFECCHVWPNTCYDIRYHTVIANLVLIPAALASLTDYSREVQSALQYRALEIYDWHPDESVAPVKPVRYPENWRDPQPDPGQGIARPLGSPKMPRQPRDGRDEEPVSLERLQLWAARPASNVHRIIALMCDYGPLPRNQLVQRIDSLSFSRDPYGAVASLMRNDGNNYGLVFVETFGKLWIHPDIEDTTRRLWNKPRLR